MRLSRRLPSATELRLGYAAAAVLDTWLAGKGLWAHRVRYLSKPILMPLLTASLLTDPRAKDSPLRTTTLLAQVGGFGGDVALLRTGTTTFLAGVGSFGVGHVAYLTGFVRRRDPAPFAQDATTRAVAAAWALTAPAMALLAARQQRELGLPVLGYATLLAAMAAAAGHLSSELPRDARLLTTAGGMLFLVSDTLLGIGKFGLTDPHPRLESAVMATYTAAQFCLGEGAARA